MGVSGANEAAGLGLEHGSEDVAAKGSLWLEGNADVGQQFLCQVFIEQGTRCAGALARAQVESAGMRLHRRMLPPIEM